ncbi:hypothetical protein D3C84_1070990 [compost metagenome]
MGAERLGTDMSQAYPPGRRVALGTGCYLRLSGHTGQHVPHFQVVGFHQLVGLAQRDLRFVRVRALALGHFQAFLDLFEDAVLVHFTPPQCSG